MELYTSRTGGSKFLYKPHMTIPQQLHIKRQTTLLAIFSLCAAAPSPPATLQVHSTTLNEHVCSFLKGITGRCWYSVRKKKPWTARVWQAETRKKKTTFKVHLRITWSQLVRSAKKLPTIDWSGKNSSTNVTDVTEGPKSSKKNPTNTSDHRNEPWPGCTDLRGAGFGEAEDCWALAVEAARELEPSTKKTHTNTQTNYN